MFKIIIFTPGFNWHYWTYLKYEKRAKLWIVTEGGETNLNNTKMQLNGSQVD